MPLGTRRGPAYDTLRIVPSVNGRLHAGGGLSPAGSQGTSCAGQWTAATSRGGEPLAIAAHHPPQLFPTAALKSVAREAVAGSCRSTSDVWGQTILGPGGHPVCGRTSAVFPHEKPVAIHPQVTIKKSPQAPLNGPKEAKPHSAETTVQL